MEIQNRHVTNLPNDRERWQAGEQSPTAPLASSCFSFSFSCCRGFFFFSSVISPLPYRPLYFKDLLHNGISHCTWEYLPTQCRWKALLLLLFLFPASPTLFFFSSLFLFSALSLDWFNCTTVSHPSLLQQMSAILKQDPEPEVVHQTLGYFTCLIQCLAAVRETAIGDRRSLLAVYL